jgi:hypothetical protein
MRFSPFVTPGASQAARSASSRSAQDRTMPCRMTSPPLASTLIRFASSCALRFNFSRDHEVLTQSCLDRHQLCSVRCDRQLTRVKAIRADIEVRAGSRCKSRPLRARRRTSDTKHEGTSGSAATRNSDADVKSEPPSRRSGSMCKVRRGSKRHRPRRTPRSATRGSRHLAMSGQ